MFFELVRPPGNKNPEQKDSAFIWGYLIRIGQILTIFQINLFIFINKLINNISISKK